MNITCTLQEYSRWKNLDDHSVIPVDEITYASVAGRMVRDAFPLNETNYRIIFKDGTRESQIHPKTLVHVVYEDPLVEDGSKPNE